MFSISLAMIIMQAQAHAGELPNSKSHANSTKQVVAAWFAVVSIASVVPASIVYGSVLAASKKPASFKDMYLASLAGGTTGFAVGFSFPVGGQEEYTRFGPAI